MIPQAWRDYKIEFRPIVILAWLICSPAMLLPAMWFYTRDDVEWAAWVQAIGSVAAILVAVWVSRRDSQVRRDEQFRADHRYMTKAHAFATYAAINVCGSADYILSGKREKSSLDYWMTLLDVALDDIAQVDVTRFENEKAVHAFLAIKRAASLSKWTISSVLKGEIPFNDLQVRKWKENAEQQIDAFQQGILEFVDAYPRLQYCDVT